MKEIIIGKQSLKKLVYRSKRKKKKIVKATINTRNSKKDKHKMLKKKDFKIIKCGEGK